MKPKQKSFLQNLDWVTTILPFGCITLLCCLFMIFPEGSANILASYLLCVSITPVLAAGKDCTLRHPP